RPMGGNKNKSDKSSGKAKEEDEQQQSTSEMADESLTLGAVNARVDGLQHTLTDHGTALLELQRQGTKTSAALERILAKLDLGGASTSDSDAVTVATDSDATTPVSTATYAYDSAAAAARGAPDSRSRASSITFATPPSSHGGLRSTAAITDGAILPTYRPNFVVKPEELGRFDGTPEETELFIANLAAIYESEPEPTLRPLWEQAILRALPRALHGHARLWFSTLDTASRSKLTSLRGKDRGDKERDGSGGWFGILRANFGATPTILRQQARQRTWDPDSETILHYSFAKVALLKTAWTQLEDKDCITDLVDGLPLEIRQVLRVPLLRDQKNERMSELRDELRVQESYWRERHNRPLQASADRDNMSTSSGTPGYGTLLQPQRTSSAPTTYAQQPAAHPRAGSFSRSRRGKSIREDFDPKRLHYAPHPSTGRRTMAYKVPEVDEIMWCNRPCRLCKGDHFDFAHDHCSSNVIHTADVEEDYPVTTSDGLLFHASGTDF
ncbi:hypothetical protein OC842_007338, partial [Tilletia horrida]